MDALTNSHEYWMQRCLELAIKAKGYTSPNPLVGSVIIDDEGNLLGEGYHKKAGKEHAEIEALNDAEARGNSAKGATLYANLEPCCHHGRTGPCTKAIIEAGIKKVVLGSLDPNPEVSGKGMQELRNSDIEVIEGILKEETDRINRFFFHWVTTKKPWVMLKVATTLNGKITTASRRWITGDLSRKRVHQIRAEYDAILTGSGTILKDNPVLTVRHVKGPHPVRVVLDRSLRCKPEHKVFDNEAETLLFTTNNIEGKLESFKVCNKTTIIEWNGNLHTLLRELGRRNILSVMIEAGHKLNTVFIQEHLVDEIQYFTNPCLIAGAQEKNAFDSEGKFKLTNVEQLGDDLLISLMAERKS